ncbi:hypothetical protein K7432_007371 [Basidiobolus ranarum]|uniref:N-terminal Ras-GEF domain-containing protein n=1 Tax=Basidiobolus ranarum TaxID=34480 RepID=A0ABR2W061_9FUNG
MTWNHFLRNCKTKDTLSGTSSLQDYFEHLLLTEDVALDFDFTQGFSSSLDCEPPINVRYLQGSNDKPIPHNPASYTPLKFVPIHLEQTSFLNMLACIEPFESNLAHRSKEHQPATPTEDHRPSLNIPARHRLDTSTGVFKGISSASQLARKRTQSMPSKQFSKSIDSDKGSWWGLIQKPNGQPSPLYTQGTAEYVDRQECFLLTDNGELIFTICQIQTTDERSTFNLAIKGGLIDRLIDVLLFGINQKEISLIDVSGEAFIFDESEEAVFDEKEYNSYFFMAFRSFLNPVDLLTKFHQRYVEGESDPITPISESHSHVVYSPDIRVSVLKAIEYWIRNHLHDFIDSLELKDNVITFFNEIINEEVSYAGYNIERKQPPSEVEASVKSILNYLAYSSLIPISILNQYKLNGFLSQQEIQAPNQSPENPSQFESIFGCSPSLIEEDFDSAISENTDVSIPSVDDMLPEQVVYALNECALELSSRISLQDWVYTINDLEAQCLNPLAWYPKKNLHSAFEDEITISDIFMALDNCRHAVSNTSVPTTNHSLLSSLPSSISSFYYLRETIKQWVISEIVSFSIDSNLRASRIVKFVNAVSLCHAEMSSYGIEKLQIFSNKFLVDAAKSQVAIPSFVERAIISGLIAPESRVFTKAWNDAAKTLGKSTDSIQAFLTHQLSKNVQPTLSTNCINAPIKLAGLIPCIGWVIENVLDMNYNIPDHLFSSKRMLNFEKRTLICELIQSFVQWPLSCSKSNNFDSVNMMFLLSRHILPNNPELGVIREFALKENSKFKVPSGGHSNGTPQNRKVFSKLVHFEQEKLKRDFREREKLEREARDRQLDIQRRINEEARLKEKRIKADFSQIEN